MCKCGISQIHSLESGCADERQCPYPSNMRIVCDVRTVFLCRICLRSFLPRQTRQNGRYSIAGVWSCFRGDILVSGPAHAKKLLTGVQTVVSVSQRREQWCVADALHKKACPGSPQLRLVVVCAYVQVETACVLSCMESERLLAKHLHKTQRIHLAQVGVRRRCLSHASRSSKTKIPFVLLTQIYFESNFDWL